MHQYLFKSFNCWVVGSDERQNPLFGLFFCVRGDCPEAKLTSDRQLSMIVFGSLVLSGLVEIHKLLSVSLPHLEWSHFLHWDVVWGEVCV